jgi:uncharacterized protein YggE
MRSNAWALAAILCAAPTVANAEVTASPAQLTVEGNGRIGRSPDRAAVNLDIVTSDDAATRSGGKNTTIYNALLARVTALGLVPGDVKTTSYNVSFVPYPPKDLPPEQRQPRYGYVTSRSLSLNVRSKTSGKSSMRQRPPV